MIQRFFSLFIIYACIDGRLIFAGCRSVHVHLLLCKQVIPLMEKFVAIIMAVFAVPLLVGGAYLLSLGGSPYYLFAGIAMLTTAFLLFKKHWSAYGVYAIFIVVTLVWALWESGFYWWALATRLGFPLIFGVLMLLPWVFKKMHGVPTQVATDANSPRTSNTVKKNPLYYWGLLASVVVGALLSFGSLANNATDKLGELDLTASDKDDTSANLGDPLSNGQQTPEGEWSAYGGTDYGKRYSPLTQINTENVKDLEVAWQIQTGDVKGPNDVGETTYEVPLLKLVTPYISVHHIIGR